MTSVPLYIHIHAAPIPTALIYKYTRISNMPRYTGSCFCRKIQYNLDLSSPDDARTSLCHCGNCKVSTTQSQPIQYITKNWNRKHSERTTAWLPRSPKMPLLSQVADQKSMLLIMARVWWSIGSSVIIVGALFWNMEWVYFFLSCTQMANSIGSRMLLKSSSGISV